MSFKYSRNVGKRAKQKPCGEMFVTFQVAGINLSAFERSFQRAILSISVFLVDGWVIDLITFHLQKSST